MASHVAEIIGTNHRAQLLILFGDLKGLSSTVAGPCSWGFCYSRSGLGSETVHLTGSLVMLVLLALGPHSENHRLSACLSVSSAAWLITLYLANNSLP
jgi:hypothetical protein